MIARAALAAASLALLAPAAAAQSEPLQPGIELQALYKHLHAHPELSFKEQATAAYLADELETLGFEVTTGLGQDWVVAKAEADTGGLGEGVGGYGLVGVLRNGDGPTVLIRTDMDALPVPERTGLDYASEVESVTWTGVESRVMHACGHDVHMTSWVGAARRLVDAKDDWSGTLVMIAQPAEELGLGAKAMLADGLFEKAPQPDANLALHVSATLPAGEVGYAAGYALANVDSVDITVHGEGGHGAYPHTTKDPVIVAAHIVTALQTLVSRNVDPQNPAVVTVGAVHAGAKHNIISEQAELKLTVRSYDEETRRTLLDGIKRIAEGQAATFGAPPPEVVYESDPTYATYNDPGLAERSAEAIKAAIGADKVKQVRAVMGGEDFSEYGRTDAKIPSFIFWLGAVHPDKAAAAADGELALPSLHSPFFAPDAAAAIPVGVDAMTAAAMAAFEAG